MQTVMANHLLFLLMMFKVDVRPTLELLRNAGIKVYCNNYSYVLKYQIQITNA